MTPEVVDTNVLVVATALSEGWGRPRIPTDDIRVHRLVEQWVETFRRDADRLLVMDFPEKTILLEYRSNLQSHHYGRRVVQHKIDTGAVRIADLTYWSNGGELVADLPPEVEALIHDLGDRKMVASAYQAGAPIVNATDGDWKDEKVGEGLSLLGVTVVQLLSDAEQAACRQRAVAP